jgi:hypothetical protein
MKILTFNHHESYIATLANTGYRFDVVIRKGNLDLSWNTRARDVPPNVTLVNFDPEIRQKLRQGAYDVVICHTIKNLFWVWLFFKPRYIFIAHIPLFAHTPIQRIKSFAKKWLWALFKSTHRAQFFAVSYFKLTSWGENAPYAVLAPGEFPPLRQTDQPSDVLIVCNNLKERGEELGLDMINRLAEKALIRVVGNNPGISFNTRPENFAHFQKLVTGFSIYLYTIKMPWGDGYNTAMLEAMRMGMAVITVENPSSPIIHGVNGLVGKTEEELLEHIYRLRADNELVKKLGKAAIQTIERDFSEANFIHVWRTIIEPESLTQKPPAG